jgi:hypothetical protein
VVIVVFLNENTGNLSISNGEADRVKNRKSYEMVKFSSKSLEYADGNYWAIGQIPDFLKKEVGDLTTVIF